MPTYAIQGAFNIVLPRTFCPLTVTMASSSTAEVERLKTLTFQRLHPRTYLERLLTEGVRPDGRLPNEWRDVSVNVGKIVRYCSMQERTHFLL